MEAVAEKFDMRYLDLAIEANLARAQRRKNDPSKYAEARYFELTAKGLAEYREGILAGKPSFGFHGPNPGLMLQYGFDVALGPGTQTRGAIISYAGRVDEVLAKAVEFGLSSEVCTGQRLDLGGIVNGWIPRPTAYIGHILCDGVHKNSELNGSLTDVPSFFVDKMWSWGPTDLRYMRLETEDLVQFMEKVTGQKIDWAKVAEALRYARQIRSLRNEIVKLRGAVPGPMKSRLMNYVGIIGGTCAGRPEGVEYLTMVRDEVKERVEQRRSFLPEEKLRLVHYFPAPMWSWSLLDWMEGQHGAVTVADGLSYEGTPELRKEDVGDDVLADVLEWLVTSPYNWQQCGRVEHAVESMFRAVKEYSPDGVLLWANTACVSYGGFRRIIKDAIVQETGLPCCTIEYDLVDRTTKGPEAITEELEIFFEMLLERKEAWS